MSTADGVPGAPVFGSAAESLLARAAFADYLNSCDAAELESAALGEMLISLEGIQSKLALARAGFHPSIQSANGPPWPSSERLAELTETPLMFLAVRRAADRSGALPMAAFLPR
jgi:hypothetical protein